MRPKVNTEKHYNQESLFTVATGAISNRIIAVSVVVPDATADNQVRQGSVISAIYCEMWLTSDDTGQGTAIVTLEKVNGNAALMTAGNSAALNVYPNKKNVFHTFMGLTPPNTQFPTSSIKGWVKIPRGKQRMGLGDQFVLNVHGQSNGLQACGFFLYKEQY